ncbi:MAG: signal peptidase II [Pseudomonadota bacterium]
MNKTLRNLLVFFAVPLVVLVDQVTKWMVLTEPRFNALDCLASLEPCGRIPLPGVMDLSMVWNRGMSWGMLQSEGIMRWVLVLVSVVIALGFSVWLWRAGRWLTGTGLALVVGGAIGNVIDRVRFGAVVDFFDFQEIWPPYFFNYVFNVADAAITVGAALLFFDQFILSGDDKDEAKVASPNP